VRRARGCRIALAGLALAATLAAASPAAAAAVVGAQFRYWAFTDGNDNRNPLVYWSPGPFHVQLEVWDYVRGRDQFRPEVGVHLRDKRRSSYTVQWRHEDPVERLTFGTEQVLSKHFVGKAYVSPLVGADSTEVVLNAGLDYYWGSYNFASADVIRDPRGDGLWVVPVRVRLANERNDWLQFLVAPASKRTLGWAADAKIRWVRLGVERNSRFDFSTRDNVIYTAGVEFALPKSEQ
jgi:hypothetical protein